MFGRNKERAEKRSFPLVLLPHPLILARQPMAAGQHGRRPRARARRRERDQLRNLALYTLKMRVTVLVLMTDPLPEGMILTLTLRRLALTFEADR